MEDDYTSRFFAVEKKPFPDWCEGYPLCEIQPLFTVYSLCTMHAILAPTIVKLTHRRTWCLCAFLREQWIEWLRRIEKHTISYKHLCSVYDCNRSTTIQMRRANDNALFFHFVFNCFTRVLNFLWTYTYTWCVFETKMQTHAIYLQTIQTHTHSNSNHTLMLLEKEEV